MNAHLLVVAGPDKGKIYPVSDEFNLLFGRSRHANSKLNDQSVSRVHCEVEQRGKRILLTDLESGSGTFVNGKRITECELRSGDQIRIGDTQFRVEGAALPARGNDIHEQTTLAPKEAKPADAIPKRPVLTTSDRLHQLKGTKLSHYEIGDVIAKGHSGLIFKAYDFKRDRDVAFKVMWPEFSRNDDEMQRFIRAMKTMLGLNHPNLVTLYGAGKTGPYCWIAMELVEGESVTQVLARLGTANQLDWRKALLIGVAVARGLEYAHGKSIVHRNITPQNVIVGATPAVTKLGDLMLAKAMEGSLAQQITRPGEILGDVRYMAPECTGGIGDIDGRADIYSLGALLYSLLAGRPPFEGGNLIDTIARIRKEEPVRPKKFQMALPDQLEGVVLKMLAKHPDSRQQSAQELIKELEKVGKYCGVKL